MRFITEGLLFSNYWSYLSIPPAQQLKHECDNHHITEKFIYSLSYFYIRFIPRVYSRVQTLRKEP